jgi:mannitol-1-phosphate 5-dehydrogenase
VRALIIGPGRLGCGYLCPLFLDAGWETVLVTRTPEMAGRIGAAGRYRVRVTGDGSREVSGFRTVPFGTSEFEEAVAETDLLLSAVGVRNVVSLAPSLTRALGRRGPGAPLQLCVVENQDCAPVLERAVRSAAAAAGLQLPPLAFAGAVAEIAVARGSWHDQGHPEFVRDGTSVLRVDAARLAAPLVGLPDVRLTKRYRARLAEKLYVFNAGHALCAYLGGLRRHRFIHEAVADPVLRPLVAGCLLESRGALLERWPALGQDIRGPVADALRRYANEDLGDPVERVARDPIRKLGPDDRLLGPAKLIRAARKRVPTHFALGIAGALLYRAEGDGRALRLGKLLEGNGLASTLRTVCGLAPEDDLAIAIARRYRGFILSNEGALFPPVHEPVAVTPGPKEIARAELRHRAIVGVPGP